MSEGNTVTGITLIESTETSEINFINKLISHLIIVLQSSVVRSKSKSPQMETWIVQAMVQGWEAELFCLHHSSARSVQLSSNRRWRSQEVSRPNGYKIEDFFGKKSVVLEKIKEVTTCTQKSRFLIILACCQSCALIFSFEILITMAK